VGPNPPKPQIFITLKFHQHFELEKISSLFSNKYLTTPSGKQHNLFWSMVLEDYDRAIYCDHHNIQVVFHKFFPIFQIFVVLSRQIWPLIGNCFTHTKDLECVNQYKFVLIGPVQTRYMIKISPFMSKFFLGDHQPSPCQITHTSRWGSVLQTHHPSTNTKGRHGPMRLMKNRFYY
jgi:hypothetical protein